MDIVDIIIGAYIIILGLVSENRRSNFFYRFIPLFIGAFMIIRSLVNMNIIIFNF